MSRFGFLPLFFLILLGNVSAETIIIGAENDAAPWSYGNGTGYVNDLVKAAFKAVGVDVQYEVYPYARCKALTISGRLAGCFSTGKTAEMEKELFFPEKPVIAPSNILYVKKNSPLSGCDSKKWKKNTSIGLVQSYEYPDSVDELKKVHSLQIDYSMSEVLNLKKLSFSHVDAALITIDEVHSLVYLSKLAQVAPDFKVLCNYGSLPSFIAFSKKNPKGATALKDFNNGMKKIHANGELKKLQNEWKIKAMETTGALKH
jgi:polar amino acid transport system substrate-binding protein